MLIMSLTVTQWLQHPTGVQKVMDLIPLRKSLSLSHSCDTCMLIIPSFLT